MKLAEALQERADLNKKIEQLRSRITSNALMQEGVLPVEDPEQLLKELDECLNQLEKLIIVINKTNMAVVSDGELLSDLLAKRDVLKLRIASFQNTISIASNLCFRSRGDEIRQLSAVDVKALQKKVDALMIDELTVFENVELPLVYLGCRKSERKRKVMEVLDRMNIAHRAGHFPQQLSGGQQQRVAIARAVVTDCPLILADEPTGNLDSTNGAEVMELLRELNGQGTTIVMVTHSERDASFAHRIIHLLDGRVVS